MKYFIRKNVDSTEIILYCQNFIFTTFIAFNFCEVRQVFTKYVGCSMKRVTLYRKGCIINEKNFNHNLVLYKSVSTFESL